MSFGAPFHIYHFWQKYRIIIFECGGELVFLHMGNFSVTILGCGSATPTLRHFPSAQALSYGNRVMLIDCGEAAQLQLRRFGVSFAKITDIFISHLHGDHFLGLPGLLSTMALHSVGGTVRVHTFAQGAELLSGILDVLCRERPYQLEYDIIDPAAPGIVLDDKHLQVRAFPLSHRVPCVGYRFTEKPKLRHINGEAARYHNVPHYAMQSLREGADWISPDGRVVPNAVLTTPPSPSRSYAYCSDTSFNRDVARHVRGVDVLYHEATYGSDNASKATSRGHSTAAEAAEIARMAGVGRLVIGHYSKMITDEEALAAEARQVFADTVAAREGLVIDLG